MLKQGVMLTLTVLTIAVALAPVIWIMTRDVSPDEMDDEL